jgi:hypothetical protein
MSRHTIAPRRHARLLRLGGIAALVLAFGATTALARTVNGLGGSLAHAAYTVLPWAFWVLHWVVPRRPPALEVEDERLRIVHRFHDEVIAIAGIRAVALLPVELARALWRYGSHAVSDRLGAITVHATRPEEDLVVVDTDHARYLFGPKPLQPFIDDVVARLPAGVLRDALPPPVQMPAGGAHPRWLVTPLPRPVVALVVAAIVALGVLATWALEPCGASVTGRAVVIERCAAGDVEIALRDLRAASPVDPAAVRGARYRNGVPIMLVRDVVNDTVKSPALGKFRLFAWRDGPYVSLEFPERRVVLTPDDPDRFLAEVREAAAR